MAAPPPAGDPPAIDFGSLAAQDVPLPAIHPTEECEFQLAPEFVESLREHGNIQPLLLSLHPEVAGEYELINGHHRFCGLHRAGRAAARCLIVPRVVTESERHELTVQLHAFQRVVRPVERAARAVRWLELNPDKSQKDCARRFGCSASTLSRDLSDHSMGEDFKGQTAGLNTAVRQVIMTERDPARRRQAIEYARAQGPDGRLPSRDKVALFLKRARGGRSAQRRDHALRGRKEDPFKDLIIRADAGHDAIADFARTFAAFVQKHKHLPLDLIVRLWDERDRAAG